MDDLLVDTIGSINDGSVLSAVCVLLILTLIWREVIYWPRQIAKLEAENERSHAAHEKTRDTLLEEVRKGGEMLVLSREQMKTQQQAVDAMLRFISEWVKGNKGGGSL